MGTREEITGQRHHRALRLAVDLLAQHQEIRPRAEGEVEQLALERAPSAARHPGLAAARVVQPAREIDQRQVRGLARLRPARAVVAARADLADHRRRDPVPLRVRHREHAVGRQAQAVGVAEPRRQRLDRPAVGRIFKQPLPPEAV